MGRARGALSGSDVHFGITKIVTKSRSAKEPPEVVQSSLLPPHKTALRTFPKIFRQGSSTDFLDKKAHYTTTSTLREAFPSASPSPCTSHAFPCVPGEGTLKSTWPTTGGSRG